MQGKKRFKNQEGQAMTEFAIVLPLLVVLLLGIIQFGIVFNNYVTVTDAVRAGARKAAVSRLESDPVGACKAQIRSSAADLDQVKLVPDCTSTWLPGADVTVTASYPYSISLLGWVVKSGRVSPTMKERVE